MKYITLRRQAAARRWIRNIDLAGSAFLKIALSCLVFGLILFGAVLYGFDLGRNYNPGNDQPTIEVGITSQQEPPSDQTVLAAMKPGESCLLPESVFKEWPENTDGQIIPEDAILMTYKDTSEVTQEIYLPLDMRVACTAQAPLTGRPYVHRVKGPGDKKSWFQIRGAENLLHYTMNCWDAIPAERRRRMVEVVIHH